MRPEVGMGHHLCRSHLRCILLSHEHWPFLLRGSQVKLLVVMIERIALSLNYWLYQDSEAVSPFILLSFLVH